MFKGMRLLGGWENIRKKLDLTVDRVIVEVVNVI